jgi:hypothetical protein
LETETLSNFSKPTVGSQTAPYYYKRLYNHGIEVSRPRIGFVLSVSQNRWSSNGLSVIIVGIDSTIERRNALLFVTVVSLTIFSFSPSMNFLGLVVALPVREKKIPTQHNKKQNKTQQNTIKHNPC